MQPTAKRARIEGLTYWLLRRPDQAAVGALVVAGLGGVLAGGASGRLVPIDQAGPKSAQFQVDINSADWPELMQLPGVGETLARRIVQSRQREGPFRDHAELQRVPGLGPKKLEALRPYLRPIGEQLSAGQPCATAGSGPPLTAGNAEQPGATGNPSACPPLQRSASSAAS